MNDTLKAVIYLNDDQQKWLRFFVAGWLHNYYGLMPRFEFIEDTISLVLSYLHGEVSPDGRFSDAQIICATEAEKCFKPEPYAYIATGDRDYNVTLGRDALLRPYLSIDAARNAYADSRLRIAPIYKGNELIWR